MKELIATTKEKLLDGLGRIVDFQSGHPILYVILAYFHIMGVASVFGSLGILTYKKIPKTRPFFDKCYKIGKKLHIFK